MNLGTEIFKCFEYNIVKNMDRPDCPYPSNLYKAEHFFDFGHDFESNRDLGVHFGVFHSNGKYLLYHHFLEKHRINKERYLNFIHSTVYFAPSSKVKSGTFIESMSSACRWFVKMKNGIQ